MLGFLGYLGFIYVVFIFRIFELCWKRGKKEYDKWQGLEKWFQQFNIGKVFVVFNNDVDDKCCCLEKRKINEDLCSGKRFFIGCVSFS